MAHGPHELARALEYMAQLPIDHLCSRTSQDGPDLTGSAHLTPLMLSW